jgi:hypothetical protein
VELPDERTADDAPVDSAGIGPRVSAVFTAAEQAAEHVLAIAREEADDLRRRTQSDMEALRARETAKAEDEARAIVTAARVEAEEIRREARERAAAIEEAAKRREQRIDEGIRLMVDRAEWARSGLKDVVSKLDHFVAKGPPEWAPESSD